MTSVTRATRREWYVGHVAARWIWTLPTLIVGLLAGCRSGAGSIPGDGPVGMADAATVRPQITGITPTSGSVSSTITITGTDFGTSAGIVKLGVDAAPQNWSNAPVLRWSDTSIVATVPELPEGEYDFAEIGANGVGAVAPCDSYSCPRFVVRLPPRIYLNNNADDTSGFSTVTTLTYDPDTGAMTQLGSPTSLGMPATGIPGCSRSIIVDAQNRRLYAAAATGIAVFAIDSATGALSPIPGSPFLSGAQDARGMMVTTNGESGGTRLWLAQHSGALVSWTVDEATGELTDRTTFPTSPADEITMITLAIQGDGAPSSFVYTNADDGTFAGFSTSPGVGMGFCDGGEYCATPGGGTPLTALPSSPFGSPLPAGTPAWITTAPADLLIAPTGTGLSFWTTDFSGVPGVPFQIQGSPLPLTSPGGPLGLPATGDGPVFMPASGSSYIVGVQTNGIAAPPQVLPGSPWNLGPALTNLSCLALANFGGRLFAVDAGHKRIGVYDWGPGANGTAPTLTPVPGSPFRVSTPYENVNGIAGTSW